MQVEKKHILVGVTGGIAAYKAADLVSQLVKQGHDVQVVMTENAHRFISPVTFAALTGKPVWLDEFASGSGMAVPHVELAGAADLFVVVPATANTIAKLAWGLADNLLTSIALVYNKTLLVAPAMNTNMYRHPAVQENLAVLRRRGVEVIEPDEGRLACGAYGPGKLASVERLLAAIEYHLFTPKTLTGKKVIVTAGGTRENIDPVRFIGNRSSGKMGFALAKAAMLRGAEVILISGPVALPPPFRVQYVPVETAAEMREKVLEYYAGAQVVVMAAAVADYRVARPYREKIKKKDSDLELRLTRNPDILKELGEKKQNQVLVGFAAETEDVIKNAQQKLQEKNLDLMVANDVARQDAGFHADTNLVTLLFPDGRQQSLPLMLKEELAHRIFEVIESLPQFHKLEQ